MIILHILWRDGDFLLWGEREASPADLSSCGDSGETSTPYDAGAEQLVLALRGLLWDDEHKLICTQIRLLLPTVNAPWGAVPAPSRDFLADRLHGLSCGHATEQGPPLFRYWLATAVRLSWRQALTLLGACQERRLADDVFAGEDLLACAALYRYTGALVARGKFLPGLRDDGAGRHLAVWEPVLDGEEQRRFRVLAGLVPPVVSDSTSGLLASKMLAELTDRLVRFSLVTTLSRAHAERGRFYSAHDAWFAALRGDNRVIRWDEADELAELQDKLCRWRCPVEDGASAQTALLFQLVEPSLPPNFWTLRILLTGDPRPATGGNRPQKPVRGSKRSAAPFPCSRADAPPAAQAVWENLLITLGQAAKLFPALNRAVQQDGFFGCLLSAAEAHAFLALYSDLLEAAGYNVNRPAWWGIAPPGAVTLEADIQPSQLPDTEPGGLADKIELSWRVLFNGEPVSIPELEDLLASESPLVFFRGRWLVVDARRLQEALRILKRRQSESATGLEVLRMALGLDSGGHGLEISGFQGAGWLTPVLERLDGSQPFELLPPPCAFCGELRPYQLRGFSWLVFLRQLGLGACLADDMGLGKTIQALALLLHEKATGQARPALLVAPMSVLGNWLREAQRFAPSLRCRLHHGADRLRGAAFVCAVKEADLVVTSYTLLYRDYADFRRVAWGGVILDEAQNIKNPETRQAQAARALQAGYRVALTGTPMENHVGELWSVMDFLNPGMLGRRADFRERFFRPIQSGADPSARSRLRRATAPFILRRLKTDRQVIADLPEKSENRVYCPLTREQARLYQETLDNFHNDLADYTGLARRGHILAVLTRLKQICNHPSNYLNDGLPLANRSGKLLRLEEMLEETFTAGESALIFTQYAEMGHLLRRRLCQAFAMEMPFLHGALSLKERDSMVRDFQESTEPKAFILSLKAGGIGLNLTRASRVFHYDRWWNPAVENQATDRAFRIGQTRNVMVHKFICGGTLEDRIDAMIESKTALAGEIVNSGEAFLTELSDKDLEEVLALAADEEGFL
ncbi:MAG: DEAD/DEAH box helicase [Kiritimatiellae bacterium]|nr:DEAD/DEAH box helicase [Kiritimatiellia bacterium]